jgi:hypothetical protein
MNFPATRVAPEKAVFRPALSPRFIAGAFTERAMSEFWEKYKDPRWQRKRLEVMQHANFACERCRSTDKTINVHHKFYRRNADPWDYQDRELMCLCEPCHEEWHLAKDNLHTSLGFMSFDDFKELSGFSVGLAFRTCEPHVRISVKSEPGVRGMAAALRLDPPKILSLKDEAGFVCAGDARKLVAGE